MRLTSMLYRLARKTRDAEVIASGSPKRMAPGQGHRALADQADIQVVAAAATFFVRRRGSSVVRGEIGSVWQQRRDTVMAHHLSGSAAETGVGHAA